MKNLLASHRLRNWFVVTALFALPLFVVGCTSKRATSPTAETTTAKPLSIAYSDWPGFIVWEIAEQKGFFEEAGVDVELVWFEYGPSLDAFAAGQVDAVTVVCGDSLVIGANGKPSTAIVLSDYSNGNDMIVGQPGIESLTDLKGKKVGLELNFMEHLLLLTGLEKSGLSAADVEIVNVPTNETPQTLASGGVEAIGAWYPVSGQALSLVAGSKPIFTSADAPGLIYDAVHVSRESLAARRDDWKKIVAVYFKCIDFINDPATHDEAVKIMAARVNTKPEDFAASMQGTYFLDRDANVQALEERDTLDSVYGSIKHADAFYLEQGVYTDSQDAATYVDPSLVREVLAEEEA